MQSKATSDGNTDRSHKRQSHVPTFAKVVDGRKQPIRGLWIRNGRFYAQLRVENPITGIKKTRRIPLVTKEGEPAQSVAEARAEIERLKVRRDENNLPALRRTPTFAEYAAHYVDFIGSGQGTKKPNSIKKDKSALAKWCQHIGGVRLDQIKPAHLNIFIGARMKAGWNPRTVNLDVISLRCALKQARQDGWIQRLPTDGLRPLKVTTRKRPFFTSADVERICAAAFEEKRNKDGQQVPLTKNAQEFVDYVRLLAYSGARRNEALALRWEDVDFDGNQLTIGAEGDTKNRTARVVDFNPKLKAHLQDMATRLAPDSQWLFPSPQRGERDVPLKTFRESLELVRNRAGLPHFQFHDCRHHFISLCVMSGVDFMTIAAWVGHLDGGVLIGKVYGHLANEHRKRMADKVTFEPVILGAEEQHARAS